MRPILLTVLVMAVYLRTAIAQPQKELLRSVYLIGNVANVPCDAPILMELSNLTAVETSPFFILYSGDIIDDDGLEGENCADEEEKLRGLIEIAKNNPLGEVLFIPGERDWDNAGKSGLKKIKRLEDFLENELKDKEVLAPAKGCPGPAILDVGDDLRIITINTEWFLHRFKKPDESDTDCDIYNFGEFWDELDDYIEEVPNRNILIAAHHPAFSYGQYAGYKSLRRHLFPLTDIQEKWYLPLPVIGSMYAGFHQNIGDRTDLTNEDMDAYNHRLKRLFQDYENLIYASAHELDLQALYVDKNFHINSGSIEKGRAVGRGPETLFKSSERGFIKIEYFTDGSVGMKVFILKKESVILAHEQLLMASPCTDGSTGIPVNNRYMPCREKPDANAKLEAGAPDTANIAPGRQYDVGKLRRTVFGEHYRKIWAAPVNVPMLNLDTAFSGLTPYATGGGGQTHVLKFMASDGQCYYFRSVDKDPSFSLSNDKQLMKGWYGAILRDLTSGQFPYGSLMTDKLMDAASIRHAYPQLFVMPDHPKLGVYRQKFAGMLGTLELRPQGKNKGVEGFQNADKVVKTVRLFQHLLDDHDNEVDAESYAKARLFDIVVADWDRQPDNLKFMGYGDKKAMKFYAMPKDRDRAFSKWEGVFWLFDREFLSPKIASFNYQYGGYKSLFFKGRNIDRMLLNELTWEQWNALAKELQAELTDTVIAEAIAQIPKAARTIAGEEMAIKLKARRDNLSEATAAFYKQLARYVDILGSNKREIFEVQRLPEGDVKVEVFKKKKPGEKSSLLYSRRLLKNETKEIRLYGLGEGDEFHLKGQSDKSIRVRIISGDGKDLVADSTKVNGWRKYTTVYDKSGKDSLLFMGEAKLANTKDEVKFTYFLYEPNTYFPMPSVVYNKDDGFGLGFGLSLTKQGFKKPGYAMKFFFKGAATTKESFWLNANADFRQVLSRWDLQLAAYVSNSERSFRQFYGLGNDTRKNNRLKGLDFYENHANTQQLRAGLRRDFWRKCHFASAAVLEHYAVADEIDGTDFFSIYDTITGLRGMGENSYLGNFSELNLDFTDASYLPTRGAQLQLSHRYFFNLSDKGSRFGRLGADLRFYETIRSALPITVGLRGGYVQAYGEPPFYYLARLGQKDNLRGYLRNRFSGDKALYFNAELRFDLGTIETTVFPVGIGLIGFNDVGRVWTKGEDIGQWHRGYGGGFYLSPVNDNFNLMFSVAHSEEEKLLFEFSFGFNL